MEQPWTAGGLPLLNIADICPATKALGPGLRAVVWVQGCPFHCRGCIADSWTRFTINHLLSPEDIVTRILANPAVTGLTFSGGEPMLQAAGLAQVFRLARKQRELTLIVYSGFKLQKLIHDPPAPGVIDLLNVADVLIDGLYIASLNDNKGIRGSSNQRIHHLSGRLAGFDFENGTRRLEVHVTDGSALVIGVPPVTTPGQVEHAIDWASNGLKIGAVR